jgi:hypothetical protein
MSMVKYLPTGTDSDSCQCIIMQADSSSHAMAPGIHLLYLTSDRLRTSICPYHIPLDAAHTTLARACLTVLVLLQSDESLTRNAWRRSLWHSMLPKTELIQVSWNMGLPSMHQTESTVPLVSGVKA